MPTNIFDMQDTWNAGGVQFYAIKMNVNPAAFAAGSRLLDLQVNAVSRFAVDPTNGVNVGSAVGGMMGPGTVNAKGYFVDGASFTANFAPTTAEYITSTDTAALPNDRVLTDSPSIHWDRATPGQIKAFTMIGGGNVSADGVITVGQYAKWSAPTTIISVPNSTVLSDIGAAPATGGSYVAKTGDTMSGDLTISKAIPAFNLVKTSGVPAYIISYNGSVAGSNTRWSIILGDATAEGGSNSGSNFSINRHADGGSLIDAAGTLTINRATGLMGLAVDLTISKAAPQLSISSTSGLGDLYWKNGASIRWAIRAVSPVSETGGNVGSNFSIARYNDAGTLIDNALTIDRSTNVALFTVSPTAPTPAAADSSLKMATTQFVKSLGLGRNITMQVFAASGTYTPTPGTMNVIVFYKAGGGGGGGAGTALPNTYGGGGGGEGELRMTLGPVASFAGLAITIGAGGIYPFAFDTPGGNGGNTSVGPGNIAAGGAGGVQGNFGGAGGLGGRGGTGGFGILSGCTGHAGTNTNLSSLAWAAGGGHGAGGQNQAAAANSGAGGGGGTNTAGGNGAAGFVVFIELL